MSTEAIKINHVTILPGESKIVMLPMPKLYNWTPLTMPVHVIRGTRPGPILGVTSAIHGDEVNGIEIVRRLLKKPILKTLAGTLIAIPIVNIYGFLYQDRYLMDRRDLNRAFPGSRTGSLAGRLAYLLRKEIFKHTTHLIDLHSGSHHRNNLPQLRANLDRPEILKLCDAFNVPVLLHATLRDGSLREYADENSIQVILYEGGEALRFDELTIKTGLNGILNVMHELSMISLKKPAAKRFKPASARSSFWVRAPISGIFNPQKALGKRVEKGELLAKICNPTDVQEYPLFSPDTGIIIGKNNLPMVHEGAALFHIACFKKASQVADQIDEHREFITDESHE